MKEGLEKDTKKSDSSSTKDVETNSETGKKKGKEERPPTKVVVRRLPPSMTEEEFLQQIEPLPPVDYMYYVPADTSLSPHSFCRAYLNFINQSDIFIFTQKFDGYVFVDSKGLEYPAVVEFAPFQRIPKLRPGRKKDPKAGTLESDGTYLSFLEKLNAQIQENTTAGSNIKQHFFETSVGSSEGNKVSTTPLLDYLRNRHAERVRAREEKRKKDLERKRARDEQRRSAKKSEDEPAVLKVLPSQTSNAKDKFKEKDAVKPLKKRNDERIKETKVRAGKSYAEERQKQLEKREELRKKFMSSSIGNKSSKPTKLQTDQKSSEQASSEAEKNDSDLKKAESDVKSYDSEVKKESYTEKKSYQHKYSQDSQKHYDYNKRDDDAKRRSRESDRINKTKEPYHDRREDKYGMRKKISGDNKKMYSRYEDKYKKDHYGSKKEGINHGGPEKKADNEKVIADSAKSASEVKKNVVCETKQKESLLDESSVKKDSSDSEEKSGKVTETGKNDLVSDTDLKTVSRCPSESRATSEQSKDSNETENSEKSQTVLESCEKNIPNSNEEKVECPNEKESKPTFSLDSSSVPVENDDGTDSEKLNVSKNVEESDSVLLPIPIDETDTSWAAEEINGTTKVNSESERSNENVTNSDERNKKIEEVVIKRRNSMEMYDRKNESVEKNNRRENVRRSSLESGDQHTNYRPLEQDKNERKKAEGDNSECKPKDPRTERRIRNKDRPTMEIYRPGMGRFSKQRMEREKVLGSSTEVDSNSPSPSPTLVPKHKTSLVNNSN